MTTKKRKSETRNFVDFVVAARKNPQLANEFLSIKSKAKLLSFFHKNGFEGIYEKDCIKLLEITKNTSPLEVEEGPFVYAKL
ncbi:hypothetical protein D1BOALGB6SA_203 [Olavius sp. associated proteobacterium Delta 1]|nr:hypothetical protein D1BOALGB6SA_203 [Olavius sp. associated proteobacterium Delta 1]